MLESTLSPMSRSVWLPHAHHDLYGRDGTADFPHRQLKPNAAYEESDGRGCAAVYHVALFVGFVYRLDRVWTSQVLPYLHS